MIALAWIPLVAAVAASPLEGVWRLRFAREGMWPPVCRGQLVLKSRDGGTLRFQTALRGSEHTLDDVRLTGSRFSFDLADGSEHLRFEGRLRDECLEGTVEWQGLGRFEFTARRFDDVPLFEDDAPSAAFPRARHTGHVRPEALKALVREAEDTGSDTLLVVRDGKLLCHRTFGGTVQRIETHSVTKSIVSLAFGVLLQEEELETLDVPVSAYFPEWEGGKHGQITVRHLLDQTSGLRARAASDHPYTREDIVQQALDAEIEHPPGTMFAYNNRATSLLPAIVEKLAGAPIDEYLAEFLFEPLAIEDTAWLRDPSGNPHGMSGLQMRALDLARIGQLILDDGVHEGRRLLPKEYLTRIQRPPVLHGGPFRYSLLWYLTTAPEEPFVCQALSAQGYLGQYLVVVPEHRLLAVRQRRYPGMDEPDDLWSFPAFPDRVLALVK